MSETFSHEREVSSDYLFSLNNYFNQRSSRLPLNSSGHQPHMDDFVPLAHGYSHPFEKKMFLGFKTDVWRRILFPHEFKSRDMEKLFRLYAYPFCFDGLRCLLILMIALTVSLSIVNFVFVSRLSLENIANSSLCLSFVVILICIHTRFMTHRLVSVVTVLIVMLCLVFCAVSFAVDEQILSPGFDHKFNLRRIMSGGFTFSRVEAVWRICYVTFVMYAFVPLKFYLPVLVSLFVSLLHSLLAVFLPSYQPNMSPVLSKQVIANLFVFLILNMVCVYLYRGRERELRTTFNHIKLSSALHLQLQDENDKADKLLASMVPSNITLEMKRDLQTPHLRNFFQKVYVQKYENVSIVFGDFTGLRLLSCQCSALEFVRFVNEAVGRFDQLAAENHCQRIQVQGDRYFCISGIPDQRNDHARCCVEMAIDLIDFTNFVGNLSNLNLRMRVGVHSGHVTCGVVGVARWQYDAWSDHVEVASLTEKAGQAGKVLITSSTLDHLQEEFVVVANRNNCNKLESMGIRTFFVVTEHPRKHYFLPKNSTANNPTKNIGGVLSAIKFNVEQPLSNIVSRSINFISSNNSFEDAGVFVSSKSNKKSSNFSERHRKHLIQLIANKSTKKKKTEHVNYLSLSFKSASMERNFKMLEDDQFASKLFIALVLLVMSMIIHALILPRTIFLLVFFLVCFAWISVVLMLVLGYRIRCVGCDVKQSSLARQSIVLVSILLHYVMSFLNTLCCRGGIVFPDKMTSPSESMVSFHHPSHLECPSPQYIYLNVLPCLFLVFLFTRLSASSKLFIWLLISLGYLMIMEFANRAFFFNYDSKLGSEIPSDAPGILMLLHFLIALYLSSRDFNWLFRLKFIWHDQVRRQKMEISMMESLNQDLFHNLLPDHVVPHFDNVPENKMIDFYSQNYSKVAVMQASVSNVNQTFNEPTKKFRTVESLRLLHEIISAFDRVQLDPRFTSTVKIKSSGPSYLVVAGLKPNNKIDESKESRRLHLNILMELLLKMKETLNSIGRGRLTFRAGIDLGPATVGVIGARKPQYEVIGDCVSTAYLLNSTSLPNCIQVSESVYESLNGCYEFKCRGSTKLKNNKEQTTYFLVGANPIKPTNFFNFSTDEDFVGYNNDKFTELPSFDHSIKRPQPITPQTPSKPMNGSVFNFSSTGNPVFIHPHNDQPSAFSPNIQASNNSTDSQWNQWNQSGSQSFNLNQLQKSGGFRDAHLTSSHQSTPKSNALPSKHPSAFVPTAGGFSTKMLTGKDVADARNHYELFKDNASNDGNNNSYLDHSRNLRCSQSYTAMTLIEGTYESQQHSQNQSNKLQLGQSSPKKVEEVDGLTFFRNENNIIERKPSTKDKERKGFNSEIASKDGIRFSCSDAEDIEALMTEIGTNRSRKSLFLYLSEEQELVDQEEKPSETVTSDEKTDEGGLVHLENGIIYTKRFINKPMLGSVGQVEGANQQGSSIYTNAIKLKPLSKKCHNQDQSNSKLFETNNSPLVHHLQNPPKSAFMLIRHNGNNAVNKSPSSQNSKTSSQNGNGASLAKKLLAANLTAKLRLHQQVAKKSDLEKCHPRGVGAPSRHSIAVPPQTTPDHMKDRWGCTDSPSRSKSLDRITVEVSGELNSSSSIGESSPKMLQRTSNKRNIASLCTNGLLSSESHRHMGSGFLQIRHSQNHRSKLHSNPVHLTSALDCLSLSSFNSEMSRSDPALSYESSSAIESEYDNYRPGMASDEDYFAVEPVSDVEIDIFDEANIDDVKVDDYENYNFDSLMSGQSGKLMAEQ